MKCFPKRFVGVTIGKTIHLRAAAPVTPGLLAEEYRHCMQYAQYGWLGFLWRYLGQLIRHGYAGNLLEVDARNWAGRYQLAFKQTAALGTPWCQAVLNSSTGEVLDVLGPV
jgi:hypothetical protein